MEMLRDKIKGLERQIVEMIRNGQDNVAIADKLHRWTRALMLTANAADLPEVLVSELQHQFHDSAGGDPRLGRRRGVRRACRSRAPSATTSRASRAAWRRRIAASTPASRRCSGSTMPAEAALDRDGAAAPRAARGAFGLLVLASPDPTRYSADMGTEFLARIGEIASAALTRLLPPM